MTSCLLLWSKKPFENGVSSRKRICSCGSKFFPSSSNPHSGGKAKNKLVDLRPLKVYPFTFISVITVKILKIGTPEIITIIVLQLEHLDFTVQHCVQKMQTE